jgi:Ca2+-binding RTX toxin-like protein
MTRAQANAAIAAANAGDTATFGSLTAVNVDLERATQQGGEAEGDTLIGIENLVGTLRADVLRGDDKVNVLEGGAGSDTLEGRGGADTLNGGTGGIGTDPGRDTASYASSDAAVNIDLIRATQTGGDAQGDTLISIENLQGSRFGDQLRGDDLDNVFDAGFGNDVIDGRGGSDTIDLKAWDVGPGLSARSVAVTLAEVGDGTARRTDFFQVSETDTLRGIENVLSTNVKDTITGNSANNRLEGRAGNDVLSGGGGADTIVGGTGSDDMTGGTGADVFDFNAFDEMSLASGSTFDIIRDFQSGVDRIDLRDLGDLTAVGSLQSIAGQVQFVTGTLNGIDTPALLIDRNGDNVADHVVFVQTNGGPFPLNSDLLII